MLQDRVRRTDTHLEEAQLLPLARSPAPKGHDHWELLTGGGLAETKERLPARLGDLDTHRTASLYETFPPE